MAGYYNRKQDGGQVSFWGLVLAILVAAIILIILF